MTNKHNKHLLLGLVVASTLTISTTVIMSARASEPRCYLQTNNGKLVDLTKLCDRQTSPTPSPVPQAAGAENPATATGNPQKTVTPSTTPKVGKIDPNAPAITPRVWRDKPSDLWYTLPDLPSPPKKGSTSQ